MAQSIALAVMLVCLLFPGVSSAARRQCENLFSVRVDARFIDNLADQRIVIGQNIDGLQMARAACGPVCVTNLSQITAVLSGRGPMQDPVLTANKLNVLRVVSPEGGSSYEEILSMLNKTSKSAGLGHVKTVAALLDIPANDFDESIPRVDEINRTAFKALNSNSRQTKFELLGFAALIDGEVVGGHLVLVLGRDRMTGHVLILDPSIGKTALISFHDHDVLGRKSLLIKFEGSLNNDPYWASYQNGPELDMVVTGVISVKFKK